MVSLLTSQTESCSVLKARVGGKSFAWLLCVCIYGCIAVVLQVAFKHRAIWLVSKSGFWGVDWWGNLEGDFSPRE